MICPKCGLANAPEEQRCRRCGLLLRPEARKRNAQSERPVLHIYRPGEEIEPSGVALRPAPYRALKVLIYLLCWLISLSVLGLGVYKLYFWIQAMNIEKTYGPGSLLEPVINEITLDDGQKAHELVFYGDDGDVIFIKELRQSYMVVGGIATIQIADSSWFDLNPENQESARVTLTPIMTKQSGDRLALPAITLDIPVPDSPLTMISPTEQRTEVYSSLYPLEFQVVPGSTVLVNGDDVTDMTDVLGNISVNVNCNTMGDNPISIVVTTPHHRQTRYDLVLARPEMEINLELSLSNESTSSRSTMTVSGTIDPNATLVIDSPYVQDSVTIDSTTGEFSFKAKFDKIGENEIVVRATQEGKKESKLSFTVDYLPNITEYSSNAWKMDYKQLSQYTNNWIGRIFLCEGTVLDTAMEDEITILYMDVSPDSDGSQVVAIYNLTSQASFEVGKEYKIFADVRGMATYNKTGIPALNGRYLSEQ